MIWFLSGIGNVPTPLSGIARSMLLARRLKDHFQVESQAHNFLFGTNILLLLTFSRQSLLLRSESACLFLFYCAVSLAWGRKAYCTIVRFPGNPGLLRVSLASRGNSASKNLQQETQQLKCCLYKTPYVAAPIGETGDVIARTPLDK
jgi:hypothetical protein